MNNRAKSYELPHKGIRNALSQLSLLAGNVNYNDAASVNKLYELGKNVFMLLRVHAEDENNVTLRYLEERYAGGSQHDMEEHEKIEALQAKLEALLDRMYTNAQNGVDNRVDADAFYTGLSEFHALYLQHMQEEERETQTLLWQHFTDEELAGHRMEIIRNLQPNTLLQWIRFMVPAQNHTERTMFVKGMKINMPEAFYNQINQVIQDELAEHDYNRLQQELV